MIKIINNAGKVIEVTKVAYEILYKNREGFSLYVKQEKKNDAKEKKEIKKATASKANKKTSKQTKKTDKKSPAKKEGDK